MDVDDREQRADDDGRIEHRQHQESDESGDEIGEILATRLHHTFLKEAT
jgi:hypothetical protein